jgi:YfiH family protein
MAVQTTAVVSVPGFPAQHGFSTVALGSMGLTRAPDPEAVMARRARLADAVGFDLHQAVLAVQVHGANVRAFQRDGSGNGAQSALETDALASNVPGQALLTYHADCYPVLVVAAAQGAVAAAHAGWRGIIAGVVPATIDALARRYGGRRQDLDVLIGPGICGDCYEVGEEVAAQFQQHFADRGGIIRTTGSRPHIDLAAAIVAELHTAGVDPDRIRVTGWCTREEARWFSHRGGRPGRFLAAIVAPPAS